ncbi:MAG: 50S ribosomal protein L21 [Alphaproteobacteria bacterium]
MFAVIRTGGKQYRIAKDDVIAVEKLASAPGDRVEFDEVLMLADGGGTIVGTPRVEEARVLATVVEQSRGPKIVVFKKKRRKNYRRKKGHRQDLTVVRITDILAAGDKPEPRAKAKTGTKRKAARSPAAKDKAETPAAKEKKEAKTAAPAKASAPGGSKKESAKAPGASKTAKAKTKESS